MYEYFEISSSNLSLAVKPISIFVLKFFERTLSYLRSRNWSLVINGLGNFSKKKAKRLAKEGPKKDESKEKLLDASKPITLDFLTNPNKEWVQKIKMSV